VSEGGPSLPPATPPRTPSLTGTCQRSARRAHATPHSKQEAWAERGEPSALLLITAMADEFGGEIHVGPFALIGDDSIGGASSRPLSGHRQRHTIAQAKGLWFAIGKGRPARRGQGRP